MLPEHCSAHPALPPARVEGPGGCVLRAGTRAAATGMELAQDRAGALTPLLAAISAPAAKRGRPLN